MATTLYISGFGSTYKPYIPRLLSERWGSRSIYYVLKNVLREDEAALEGLLDDMVKNGLERYW